jgi:hypothetical protein
VCVPDAEGREQCQIQIPLGIKGLWIRFLRKGGGIGIGHSRISVLRWYGCTGWEVERGALMLVGYDCDRK